MALGLLCLGLILLGDLKIQAEDSPPSLVSSSPLSNVPTLPDFQHDQFKGKWYTIGWAVNTVWNENQSKGSSQSTTHEPNDDHSHNVTSDSLSDWGCTHKSDIIFPSDQPGLSTFENLTRYDGLQSFVVRMLETDSSQFAVVFFRMTVKNMVYVEHTLYGRTMEVDPLVKEHYHKVTLSLGIPENHIIYADPKEKCTD